MVIIDGGGGDESPKSGRREFFVGGVNRIDNIYVSGSVVVGGEDRRRQGTCQRLGVIQYYYFL